MAIHDYSVEEIHDIAKAFDINSVESQDEAYAAVTAQGGMASCDVTPDADLPNAIPIGDALNFSEFSKSEEAQKFLNILQTLHDKWVRQSKNEKLTQDARTLNHHKGMGMEEGLIAIGEAILESQERVDNASVDERRAIVRHRTPRRKKAPVAELEPEPEVTVSDIIDEVIAPTAETDDLVPIRIDGIDFLKRAD